MAADDAIFGLKSILLYFSSPPTHPDVFIICKMAANLQVELSAMMDIVQTHAKVAEFFLKEGILDTEAVALLAGSEDWTLEAACGHRASEAPLLLIFVSSHPPYTCWW